MIKSFKNIVQSEFSKSLQNRNFLAKSGMERRRSEAETRKGPWTAEEDEILINFVRANGPRDWSSIRSQGLLPRTGKSCRLRWVNKLRPNLKKGCKFSAEEERLVLDLQATLGNRWATIASYLPGRTDNDVKNFWSTRQKRLARILRSSSQSSTSREKNKCKLFVDDEASSSSQVSKSCSDKVNEASFPCRLCSCFCNDNSNGFTMLPVPSSDCLNQCTTEVNTSLPPLADVQPPFWLPESTDSKPPMASSSLHVSHGQHPQPTVDFPFLQETNEYFSMEVAEPSTMDVLTCQEALELGNIPQLDLGLSVEEVDRNNAQNYERANQDKIPVPDNVFNDLPADLFEYLEGTP